MITKDTFFLIMAYSFPSISDCVPIGKISRPHGNEGFVLISLHNEYQSICKEIEYVFLLIQNKLVPFFIQKCTVKGGATYMQFDDITSIDLAEKICGNTLYIPSQFIKEDDDTLDELHQLIGFKIFSNTEYIGIIKDVFEYSMNIVLEIETQTNDEKLIPFSTNLVIDLNYENQTLIMNLPEGIFDI
ncbi:MAG TPA: ribosome maturation factor RimM [Bacteroidales bacterium]|nr:ribosome maturation factor RimM [Bacteroidales bacterium]